MLNFVSFLTFDPVGAIAPLQNLSVNADRHAIGK
jgi:hypothetical protein